MEKTYYVAMVKKENVGHYGVWDLLHNKDCYICDEEWMLFSWTDNFNEAKRFSSPAEIIKLLHTEEVTRLETGWDKDGASVQRPNPTYRIFGLLTKISSIEIQKISVKAENIKSISEKELYDVEKTFAYSEKEIKEIKSRESIK